MVLWPKLWEGLQLGTRAGAAGDAVLLGQARLALERPIKWRNYYDFGDPIGFKFETAALFLKLRNCEAFEFDTRPHDLGFSR